MTFSSTGSYRIERGTLEPGTRADFLMLEADPLERIENTVAIAAIWHGGKAVVPMTKRAAAGDVQPREKFPVAGLARGWRNALSSRRR